MNGNNSISRKKNQSNPIRRRISKSRSQWRWLQRIHGWLIEDEWSRKERHLAEQERGYRLHLGGVFIKGNAGLD